MGLRKGESLIQYRQGLFSRIKNTIVSLFSNDMEEQKTANVGHDRLHEVLKQDRIKNNDIRVTKTYKGVDKVPEETKPVQEETLAIQPQIKISKEVQEEVREALEIRYIDDNKSTKSDIEELLNILDILSKNKVDTKKIKTFKSVNKHRKSTILKDINQPDVDINKIIKNNNLIANYPIGRKIELARRMINNIEKYRRGITKEQITQLETLGIIK